MSYLSNIDNAKPVSAPKNAGTKDVIYGQLLQAKAELHKFEACLQRASTQPSDARIAELEQQVKDLNSKLFAAHSVRAKAQKQAKALASIVGTGNSAWPRGEAPATPEERRAAMAAARERAMAGA